MSTRERSRYLLDLLATALLCVTVALLAFGLIFALLGYRGVTIKSGSMTPTIAVGSLVVSQSVHPLQMHPGQIVTFRDPALHEQLVTHRVLQIRRVGGRVDFVTKGDANVVTEKWYVPVSGHVGREVFAIPDLGRWLTSLNAKQARLIEIALGALLLGYAALRWIWRPQQQAPGLSTT